MIVETLLHAERKLRKPGRFLEGLGRCRSGSIGAVRARGRKRHYWGAERGGAQEGGLAIAGTMGIFNSPRQIRLSGAMSLSYIVIFWHGFYFLLISHELERLNLFLKSSPLTVTIGRYSDYFSGFFKK